MWSPPPKPPPEINPDGVVIKIPYNKWEVGMSVFIPALNLKKLKIQLRQVARHKGWRIEVKGRVEGGKLGLRIWRIV